MPGSASHSSTERESGHRLCTASGPHVNLGMMALARLSQPSASTSRDVSAKPPHRRRAARILPLTHGPTPGRPMRVKLSATLRSTGPFLPRLAQSSCSGLLRGWIRYDRPSLLAFLLNGGAIDRKHQPVSMTLHPTIGQNPHPPQHLSIPEAPDRLAIPHGRGRLSGAQAESDPSGRVQSVHVNRARGERFDQSALESLFGTWKPPEGLEQLGHADGLHRLSHRGPPCLHPAPQEQDDPDEPDAKPLLPQERGTVGLEGKAPQS